MTRLTIALLLAALCLPACTQSDREGLARDMCDSASNCTVYDENGRETRKRDLCHDNPNCRRH